VLFDDEEVDLVALSSPLGVFPKKKPQPCEEPSRLKLGISFPLDDGVSLPVNLPFFGFGHSAGFHRLTCARFRVFCVRSVFDGIGSLLDLSELVFGEFVTPSGR
jgi:hypothetical protein